MPRRGVDEGGLILQAQPEEQVHLSGFEIPIVGGGPVQNIGFPVAPGSNLLIGIGNEPVGDHFAGNASNASATRRQRAGNARKGAGTPS